MIEKTIHWCWLSDTHTELVDKCMQTWRRFCPDYTIKKWDLTNIDFNDLPPWCRVAYENKIYAFVSDYIRAKAVYDEGGVYLDSDVCLCKYNPFKEYEEDRMWIPMEDVANTRKQYFVGKEYIQGKGVNPVFFGAEKKHPCLWDIMERYWELPSDYALTASTYWRSTPIAPSVWSAVMERHGLEYENKEQHLMHGIHVLTDEKFRHLAMTEDRKGLSALHLACNSWVGNKNKNINHNGQDT